MAAPKGNRFWEVRSSHGRNPIFKNDDDLWKACLEYFQWVEDNPLGKAIIYQGDVSAKTENLMRAMTIKGLCIFLGVNSKYFNDFKDSLDLTKKEDNIPVIKFLFSRSKIFFSFLPSISCTPTSTPEEGRVKSNVIVCLLNNAKHFLWHQVCNFPRLVPGVIKSVLKGPWNHLH